MFKKNFVMTVAAMLLVVVLVSACSGQPKIQEPEKVLVLVPSSFFKNEDGSISWQYHVSPQGEVVGLREDPQLVVEINNFPAGFVTLSDVNIGPLDKDRYSHGLNAVAELGDIRNGVFNHHFKLSEVTTIFVILEESGKPCDSFRPKWGNNTLERHSFGCYLPKK